MGSLSSLNATAAAAVALALAVLAATAEAAGGTSMPVVAAGDFLSSSMFLWVTANAIIGVIWLLSYYRRGGTATDNQDDDGGEVMHDAVDTIAYTSASEYEYYEAFSDAGRACASDAGAAVSRRLAREERAARRADSDSPRVHAAASRAARAAAAAARDFEEEIRRAETTTLVAVAAAPATEAMAAGSGVDGNHDDEDVSMDTLWQSIVQRRAARPVVVQKSESWGNDELPRLERVAATAAATRREMRKSVSAVNKAPAPVAATQPPQPSVPAAVRQMGWRTRDVLETISPDDLMRRAESFIRRQREHLRLQRQESEQRQLQIQRRLHAPPPLIRV